MTMGVHLAGDVIPYLIAMVVTMVIGLSSLVVLGIGHARRARRSPRRAYTVVFGLSIGLLAVWFPVICLLVNEGVWFLNAFIAPSALAAALVPMLRARGRTGADAQGGPRTVAAAAPAGDADGPPRRTP